MVNGWRIDADFLVGRRFEFTNGAAPDVTFVAAKDSPDGDLIRAHCINGSAQWLSLDIIAKAIAARVLVEAEAPPFVHSKPVENGQPLFYHQVKAFYPGAR